jgi:hypothetical protein
MVSGSLCLLWRFQGCPCSRECLWLVFWGADDVCAALSIKLTVSTIVSGHRAGYMIGTAVRKRDIERRTWNSLLGGFLETCQCDRASLQQCH